MSNGSKAKRDRRVLNHNEKFLRSIFELMDKPHPEEKPTRRVRVGFIYGEDGSRNRFIRSIEIMNFDERALFEMNGTLNYNVRKFIEGGNRVSVNDKPNNILSMETNPSHHPKPEGMITRTFREIPNESPHGRGAYLYYNQRWIRIG